MQKKTGNASALTVYETFVSASVEKVFPCEKVGGVSLHSDGFVKNCEMLRFCDSDYKRSKPPRAAPVAADARYRTGAVR